jgi:glutamate-1-semialdehyde 2,1-aminomutase
MYPDPNSKSAQLYERACKVMPGGSTRSTTFIPPYPPYARSGHGCLIIDVDGTERIDFLNNYTSLIHGHAHPKIVQAVTKQVSLGTCFPLPTETEIQLAELLCSRVPSFEHIRFTNSGTEAVMTAIKAARAHTGRSKIAKCEGAYHGSYDYAEVSLDSSPNNWGELQPVSVPYAEGTPPGVLRDVVVIPLNDTAAAEHILTTHAAELAGVIVDPLPYRIGLIPASAGFLRMLRAFTKQHDSVLIFDEVISFRLGYQGAQNDFGVKPDITTLGKIIGGGFPVGAVAGQSEVMAVFDQSGGKPALPHAGTFNANPITMVAGLAAMKLMDHETYAQINALGEHARSEIRRAFSIAGVPGQVTGMGSLFRLHLSDRPLIGYRAAYPRSSERQRLALLHRHLLNHGILIAPSGMGALSTPMSEIEIHQLAESLVDSLRKL